MHAQEVTKSSLASIAQGLRTGEIRSADILGHSIACHAKSESRLGAYRTWCGDRAQRQAIAIDQLIATNIDLGPLMGIPVSVKDLYGVPGLPTFAGTDAELSSDWEKAGPLINALQTQLGVVVGKTHTVEFAFGGLGTNPHSGTPVNPWSQIDAPVLLVVLVPVQVFLLHKAQHCSPLAQTLLVQSAYLPRIQDNVH